MGHGTTKCNEFTMNIVVTDEHQNKAITYWHDIDYIYHGNHINLSVPCFTEYAIGTITEVYEDLNVIPISVIIPTTMKSANTFVHHVPAYTLLFLS